MGIDERAHHTYARFPEAKVHLYGKSERPGRKIGHVTVGGDDLHTVRARARTAADHLSTGRWSDGWDPHA
jgi:5-(carboxyamino)imidazole ribonucleotide synthase